MTLVSSVVILSSGCSIIPSFGWGNDGLDTKPVEVQIKTVEVKRPIVHPVMPRPIDLKEPKWFVVSEKNFKEFQEEIKKTNGGNLVFLAMSIGDYELMAFNMQEIKRYVNEMKEVVIYYRTINEDPKPEEPKDPEKKDDKPK